MDKEEEREIARLSQNDPTLTSLTSAIFILQRHQYVAQNLLRLVRSIYGRAFSLQRLADALRTNTVLKELLCVVCFVLLAMFRKLIELNGPVVFTTTMWPRCLNWQLAWLPTPR